MTKPTRNLIIFAVAALASGWLGYVLDRAMNNPPDQQLGMLLWLIGPLLTAILLRTFGGDGWQDAGLRPHFRRNAAWYVASLLLQPTVLVAVVVLGLIRIHDAPLERWLPLVAAALAPTLIKNVFEEFSWRGYLAPRLQATGVNRIAIHALTGLVWGGWHLPYWLVFSGMAPMQAITGQSLMALTASGFVSVVVASVGYNELRFATGSVWPALILHTVGNLVIDALLGQGFLQMDGTTAVLVLPVFQVLLSAALLLFARLRTRRASQPSPARVSA